MFVRTENGIYETIKCLGDGSCYCNNGNKNKYISSFEILKQSDNLADLCDEFRYEFNNFLKHEKCWRDSNTDMWYDYDTDIDISFSLKAISTIKGAIWTDKGLIYVAKLNEKGEFELL